MFYLFESLHGELMSQIQQSNPKGNFYENVCFKPQSECDTWEQPGHGQHSHTTSATDRTPDEPKEQRNLEEPPSVTPAPGLCGCLKPADEGDLHPPVKNNDFISAGEGN